MLLLLRLLAVDVAVVDVAAVDVVIDMAAVDVATFCSSLLCHLLPSYCQRVPQGNGVYLSPMLPNTSIGL